MYDLLCLDERDSPNLTELKYKTKEEIESSANKRHFGIAGVIIPSKAYTKLNMYGRKIQQKCFGKGIYKPLHYVDLLNKRNDFSILGKDTKKCKAVENMLNYLVKSTDFKIISAFIDKSQLALDYGDFPNNKLTSIRKIKPNMSKHTTPEDINLYDISLKLILKSFCKYLKEKNHKGIIIAEARGEKEDKTLLDSFYYFQQFGAGSLTSSEIRKYIIDLLIIRKSQNHIGTQLADIIAYPLYDNFIDNHNIRKDHLINKIYYETKIYDTHCFPQQKRS